MKKVSVRVGFIGTMFMLAIGGPGLGVGAAQTLAGQRFPEVDRLGRALHPVVKEVQREHIKSKTQEAMTRPMNIRSADRVSPPSKAHDHGAIDVRSNDISRAQRHDEARAISRSVGPNNRVVVEEVHRPGRGQAGRSVQIDTTYQNGQRGAVRTHEIRASETHTHIQPNQGIGWKAKGAK